MNHLRVTKNVYNYLRKTTKGGGGLPHNDPPAFKNIKNKRYATLTDHTFWFKDAYEQHYWIIKKHNQYRGLLGMAWNIFRFYVLGTLVPIAFYLKWKDYCHDQKNYYNAFFVESPTSPNWKRESNFNYRLENIRNSYLKAKDNDVLGRRGSEYYNILSNIKNQPLNPSSFEARHMHVMKTTAAGRSG